MAVVIVTSPSAVNPIANGVIWKLNLDDFGTPPESNKIAFQVVTAANDEITPIRTVKPPGNVTPKDFNIDATKAIKDYSLVKTSVPTLGLGTPGVVENDAAIIQAVKLKYGQAIYSSEDCGPTVELSQESAAVKVINSAVNIWDTEDFNDGSHFVLNSIPSQFPCYTDTRVWLWVFNAGSGAVVHTAHYKDGTTDTLNGSADPSWQVAIFALSNAALSDNFTASKLVKIVSVFTFPVGPSFTFTTCYIPCIRPQIIQEFYALDPLGGFNTFIGERVETEAESDVSTTEIPFRLDDPDYETAGTTILEKETRLVQTYIRKFPNDEEHAKYLTAIEAATRFLVRIKDEGGGSKLCTFNTASGIQVFKTDGLIEVQIKGTIGVPILTQIT